LNSWSVSIGSLHAPTDRAMLIEDYLYQFNILYPNSITPKLHYMLHLPRQIQLYWLLLLVLEVIFTTCLLVG